MLAFILGVIIKLMWSNQTFQDHYFTYLHRDITSMTEAIVHVWKITKWNTSLFFQIFINNVILFSYVNN